MRLRRTTLLLIVAGGVALGGCTAVRVTGKAVGTGVSTAATGAKVVTRGVVRGAAGAAGAVF